MLGIDSNGSAVLIHRIVTVVAICWIIRRELFQIDFEKALTSVTEIGSQRFFCMNKFWIGYEASDILVLK